MIPVDTPFEEYEAMRALRCECGGALSWGERECERLGPPRERYVVDRYTLTCGACGRARSVEFLCDTGSDTYADLRASAFAMALGLGPDGAAALLAAAAGEPPVGPKEKRPRRAAKKKTSSAKKKTSSVKKKTSSVKKKTSSVKKKTSSVKRKPPRGRDRRKR